ncbi:hypothetical protein NT6N_16230 [Oceaniferula spumae]|uniref:MarR family transcriptional regulator n=1 Tax=Oceaniferula spumae TaxID=2979115 RepID=A0AAT9FKW3_9BACT
MQKLAQLAGEMSDQMSAEQFRLYKEMISRQFEAKLAEEAFRAAAAEEDAGDDRRSESLRQVHGILDDEKYRLSGSESVLLGCHYKMLEGDDEVDTKRLNILLHRFNRKPANTTKIVDTLTKKKLMETSSEGMHSHKTFFLTPAGQDHVNYVLGQLSNSAVRDRLSVVD